MTAQVFPIVLWVKPHLHKFSVLCLFPPSDYLWQQIDANNPHKLLHPVWYVLESLILIILLHELGEKKLHQKLNYIGN